MERFVLPRLLANRTEAGRVSLVIRLDFMLWFTLGSKLGGQTEKRAPRSTLKWNESSASRRRLPMGNDSGQTVRYIKDVR
jgi:hypothetical protein